MNKIENFAKYCTTAQKATFTSLDGNSRLNVVTAFYNENGINLPSVITVSQSKKGVYLTKDEKIQIQSAYISALVSGTVSEEIENNFRAVTDSEAVATFSETLPFSEAVKSFGPAIVAAKMIDNLSVSDNEKFHKVRKFDVPANVAISEIPAFIKALETIYKENTTK